MISRGVAKLSRKWSPGIAARLTCPPLPLAEGNPTLVGPNFCHFCTILTASVFPAGGRRRRKWLRRWEIDWFALFRFTLELALRASIERTKGSEVGEKRRISAASRATSINTIYTESVNLKLSKWAEESCQSRGSPVSGEPCSLLVTAPFVGTFVCVLHLRLWLVLRKWL